MAEEEKQMEQPVEEIVEEKVEPKDAELEEVKEDNTEEVTEEVTEEKSEETSEEKAEGEKEVPKEEKDEVTEEKPVEESVSENDEEKSSEDKEALSVDIKKTKEELAVVAEVRDELVALYAKNKEIMVEKEQLSTDIDTLSKENVAMKEQLQRYADAEQEIIANQRIEKIEQLSAKFKVLGQEKTVEQLSVKDDETLDEYGLIVDAAIEKLGETTEAPEETSSSQTVVDCDAKSDEDSKSEDVVTEKVEEVKEQLRTENDNAFYARMCSVMAQEQEKGGKVKYL